MHESSPDTCFGYCRNCRTVHRLMPGNAAEHARKLMQTLEEAGRIDYDQPLHRADPRLSLDYLFGPALGQMFGVLECLDADGRAVVLKAFSGQYNGQWQVAGWVPPLLNPEEFQELVDGEDRRIKNLGREIEQLPGGAERQRKRLQRRELSRRLMIAIHRLYRLHNFRNETASLFRFFPNGVPTGAGDCCAPKLLNFAAQNRLQPLGLAEFFWGRPNRAGTRVHGRFYAACEEKCRPILGFLLCGSEA